MEILYVKGQTYNTFGTHITTTMNAKGDITLKQYYANYDPVTKVYSGLRYEIEMTRNRDEVTGLPTSEVRTDRVFKGGVLFEQETHTHYFNIETPEGAMAAYDRNIESANKLIKQAGMYLMSQVGIPNAKQFLRGVVTETQGYRDQDRQPLLDAIAAADFTVSPYLKTPTESATIKGTLDAILNVAYAG